MSTIQELTSKKQLTKNSLINLFGYAGPLLVAAVTVPFIADGMGLERFGMLMLAWTFIGYFSLFDLGLSRSLTKLVAECLGNETAEEIPAIIWTAILLMLFIGISVSLTLLILIYKTELDFLNITPSVRQETLQTFYLLAFSIPLIIISVGFRGVLDAYQRFDLTNKVRIPLGIFTFAAPLTVIYTTQKMLFCTVLLLIMGRLAACLFQMAFCFSIVPSLTDSIKFDRKLVKPLIVFGGWMTVTNIIGPLMVYADRYVIGSLISVTEMAYYATPHEVVTKLWIFTGAIMGVLFPTFSMTFGSDPERTVKLFRLCGKMIFITLFPVILLMICGAHEFLELWMGIEFARKSSVIMQWLAIGVFFHSIGQISYTFLQGAGRPDITAFLRIAELPVYAFCLFWLIRAFGIFGAAAAWVGQIAVDTLLMIIISHKLLKISLKITKETVGMTALFVLLFAGVFIQDFTGRLLFLAALTVIFVGTLKWIILTPGDKRIISEQFSSLMNKLPNRE